MDYSGQIWSIAREVPVGQTNARGVCPFCNGGRNGDRGFSVTRVSEIEIAYCCHRATCGKSGHLDGAGASIFRSDSADKEIRDVHVFSPRVYRGDTTKLGERWLSEILLRYGISEEDATWAGWRESIETNGLACPILGPSGVRRGYEIRKSKSSAVPGVRSTSSYRETDVPWLGWYRRFRTGPVVIVEDVVSALKVSRWYQVVSLMGSHLDLERLLEILGVSEDGRLALDRDATTKAIKFIKEYRLLAPNFKPVLLSKDLKYESDERIIQLIED